ncbi:hypothetical protein FKP32DRAFT_1760572 [Trametes sanguinea]|nr:hypothetical protein FKP32DRAFT_1760572 [Trametes sanguinea]
MAFNFTNIASALPAISWPPIRRYDMLQSTPLDIFIEIFSVSTPSDLLTLSRTCKTFRAYLMSQESTLCWRAARRQLEGLPECPPDLSEQKYASLLFSDRCFSCGKVSDRLPVWEFHSRHCTPCLRKLLVPFYEGELPVRLCSVLPANEHVRDFLVTSCINIQGVSHKDGPLQRLCCWKYGEAQERTTLDPVFHLKSDINRIEMSWLALQSVDEKKRYMEEQVNLAIERRKFKDAVHTSISEHLQQRSNSPQSALNTRYRQILRRLQIEGWYQEVSFIYRRNIRVLSQHANVHVDRQLTAEEWPEIRHHVIRCLKDCRTKFMRDSWNVVMKKRITSLCDFLVSYEAQQGRRTPMSDLQAGIADLAQMKAFREIVEAPLASRIGKASFVKLTDAIPALKAEWYEAHERHFRRIVEEQLQGQELDGVDPLSLAAVTFRGVGWSQILSCRPNDEYETVHGNSTPYDETLAEVCLLQLGLPGPRSFPGARSFNPNFKAECDMIRACELDPFRTTLQDMQNCGVRLFCLLCATPSTGYLRIYDWKTAMRHHCTGSDDAFFTSDCTDNWAILDEEHTATVLALESAFLAQNNPDAYGCGYCQKRGESPPLEHCTSAHGVEDPVIDRDFYVRLDSSSHKGMTKWITIYPESAREDCDAVRDVQSGTAFFSSSLFASEE